MDETRSKSVIKVFVDLYNKGLIYRGLRMVNWDPKAQTALSNEEVVYKDEQSKLYHLKYYVAQECDCTDIENAGEGNVIHKDEKGYYAVVATTRPETIMGDTAMCINPKDPKNQWLKGKKVIVPLVGRVIPVIEDRYVDIEFGTGCLKVTPAHDTNDYMLGKTHNLDTIDIFNADGTISAESPLYVGMDRFDCRRQIAKDLQEAGLMERVEDYNNKVGYSERNPDTAIEPRLSLQWFLKMQHFADIALPPVVNGEMNFYPAKYKATYKNWLENIQDWCISRQLWWGHRIPAYYYGEEQFVVAETAEEALELARKQSGNANLKADDLRQDDFVFLHVEASDEAGHDGDLKLKLQTIENLDRRIVEPIYNEVKTWDEPVCIAVLPDHPTPVEVRTHVQEPVPFVIYYPGVEPDGVVEYDEVSCVSGSYGLLRLQQFMQEFMKIN